MNDAAPERNSQQTEGTRNWVLNALLLLLFGGMSVAAWQALQTPTTDRARTLILLAPATAEVVLQGEPPALSVSKGTHTFSVMPGRYTMEVRVAELPPMTEEITVPRGIGGLMLQVEVGPEGLVLGYF